MSKLSPIDNKLLILIDNKIVVNFVFLWFIFKYIYNFKNFSKNSQTSLIIIGLVKIQTKLY